MKLKIIYLNACLILLMFSCTSKTSQTTAKNATQLDFKISKIDINNLKYVDYALSSAAQKTTADWIKFHELSTEMEALKEAKLSFFKDDAQILRTFILDLNKTIPESLNTEDVTTRISAIENALYFLFSELNLKRQDKSFSLNAINNLLISVSNLKLQINKKLELDSQNIIKPQ